MSVRQSCVTRRHDVDGSSYQTVKASALPACSRWVFDHPFFLLLNVAVGEDPCRDASRLCSHIPGCKRISKTLEPWLCGRRCCVWYFARAGEFGNCLRRRVAKRIWGDLFDGSAGVFSKSACGTSVLVNGKASAITYVSRGRLTFKFRGTR